MSERLRLGVIGLGRAFTLMLPTYAADSRIALVAATDPRREARDRFSSDFGAKSYDDTASLCADPNVDAVYIASPHQFHVEHVKLAARHGKHILVEKPMALTVDDCLEMISDARKGNVHLLVGHSHSYDLPYLHTRKLIESGAFGRARMINAWNFTDFLYRPRRPEELDTNAGGGVVFSQAAHQVDIVRLLAGAKARSVWAMTGSWDPARPTEGAYNAQISFEGGLFASLTYSGYGHFDTDELNNWWGELGQRRNPDDYGRARAALKAVNTPAEEAELKNRRAYGPAGRDAFRHNSSFSHNHFGAIVVSCEGADLRPTPEGVFIYGDSERRLDDLRTPTIPRVEVVDELYTAVMQNRPPLHSGEWGLATLEICLAILASAKSEQIVELRYQI